MSNDRRSFIKGSLAGIAGVSGLSSMAQAGQKKKEPKEKHKLIHRTLGRTGLKLPIVSMGAGDTNNPNLMRAALDAGIVHLATSRYYGNGSNERIVGQVIKGRDRSKVVIATSAPPKGFNHKTGLFDEANPADYVRQFEESLKNLGVDYVDILYFPFVGKKEAVMHPGFLSAFEKIKKQGKAKFIGVATHSFMAEGLRSAADSKFYDLVMTSYNFRMSNIADMDKAIEYAAKAGLGIVAMKTMAGVYWDRKGRKNPINTKAALKWVLKNKNIHTAVPGVTTYDQLQQNLSIMQDLSLTKTEQEDLKPPKTADVGLFCSQCGQCLPQCPHELDIPTLMRAYMYAYGYGNMRQAQETYLRATSSASACDDCSECKVRCSQGFDVGQKIADISRIKEVPSDFLG